MHNNIKLDTCDENQNRDLIPTLDAKIDIAQIPIFLKFNAIPVFKNLNKKFETW